MTRDNIAILEVLDNAIDKILDTSDPVDRLHHIALVYNYLIDTFPITSDTTLTAKGENLFERRIYYEAIPPVRYLDQTNAPPVMGGYKEIIYDMQHHAYFWKKIEDRNLRAMGYRYVDMTDFVCDYNEEYDRFVISVRHYRTFPETRLTED